MSERIQFMLECEKELDRLKKEESFILEILRDVQKQLGKYKVEALHMMHVSLADDNDEELSDDSVMLPEMLDSAEIINKNKLDLGLKPEDDDDEEFEESETDFSD